MSKEQEWSEICPACKGYSDQAHRYDSTCVLQSPWYVRLGRSLREFFAPRDWIPSIPLPPVGSWKPKGKGTMTLSEAIQGFPEELESEKKK